MTPDPDMPSREAWSPRDAVILGAILLLAAGLRLVGLGTGLWYDELMTVLSHLRLPWMEMWQQYSMNHHYLFSFLAKGSVALFGEVPWAVRLPALLFGLGGIAALWVLARDLTGRWGAHLTALLLALSYHHIWFSQNARGYTGLAFFATLGMILWLRGLDRPRPGLWVAYGITLAAGIATHLTGAVFFAAQGLVWLGLAGADLARGRRDRLVWPAIGYLLGGALTLAFYAPVMPSLLAEMGAVAGNNAGDVMQEYTSPLWAMAEAVRTGIGAAGPLVTLVALAVLATLAMGTLALHGRSALFAPVVWLHVALTVALLIGLGMRIWPRFFFTDIGFLMLMIVAGVGWACGIAARILPLPRQAMFALAALAMVAISAALAARNYSAPKQDLAGAVALVAGQAAPGARIIAPGIGAEAFNLYFGTGWTEVQDDAAWGAASAGPGETWVVVAFPDRTLRAIPALAAEIGAGRLEPVAELPGTLGDGAVLIYRRP